MARGQARAPWWHAHPGAIVALAVALAGGWFNETVHARDARRDRELDQLERRVAAVERAGCDGRR